MGGDGARASDSMLGIRHDPAPSAESVAAVIVTFHPDPGIDDRVRPLVGQVGAIVIVDNGSSEAELRPIDALTRQGVVDVIRNGMNLGIAVALNQGLAWAEEHGYAWALTLDQDTEPGPAVVAEAARVLHAHDDRPVAVIGASYQEPAAEASLPIGREVACVITAGALHSVKAWRDVGGFRDDFFIDYVDTEFCLRARRAGYAVVQANRPTIKHAIGNPITHDAGFRTFTPTHHSRQRRYYITRNRIIVWRAYARREPRYIAYDITEAARELVKLVLFEQDRRGKLLAVLRGTRDGIVGIRGVPGRR